MHYVQKQKKKTGYPAKNTVEMLQKLAMRHKITSVGQVLVENSGDYGIIITLQYWEYSQKLFW